MYSNININVKNVVNLSPIKYMMILSCCGNNYLFIQNIAESLKRQKTMSRHNSTSSIASSTSMEVAMINTANGDDNQLENSQHNHDNVMSTSQTSSTLSGKCVV